MYKKEKKTRNAKRKTKKNARKARKRTNDEIIIILIINMKLYSMQTTNKNNTRVAL